MSTSIVHNDYLSRSVMYFGDHPYADLADVTLHHGWHTGAVIRELEVRRERNIYLRKELCRNSNVCPSLFVKVVLALFFLLIDTPNLITRAY